MAITANVEPESGRIVYAGSDFPIPIRFRFFPKKAQTLLCKTDPDPIWMHGLVRFWPNGSGPEASQCTRIIEPGFWGRTQPARHQFPTFRMRSSTDGPDHLVQNHPGSDSVLADCVRFWPNGSGPEASCHDVQESSGPLMASASEPIRIGCELDPAMLICYGLICQKRSGPSFVVLCCVVLCCAALCCDLLCCQCCIALCCVVLCCATRCCSLVLHYVVLCCAVLCFGVLLHCTVLGFFLRCCVVLCCAVLCFAALCCDVLCCAVLCSVFCCTALCCVVLCLSLIHI